MWKLPHPAIYRLHTSKSFEQNLTRELFVGLHVESHLEIREHVGAVKQMDWLLTRVHSSTSAWENTYNSPLSGQHVDQHAFPCSLPSLKSSFIFLAGGRLLNTPARHFCCSWMCILSNVVTTFNENILCAISQTTKIRNRFTSPIESCRKWELLRWIYFWFASGTDARESRVGQINKHVNSFPDMIDTMKIALGIIVQRPESGRRGWFVSGCSVKIKVKV